MPQVNEQTQQPPMQQSPMQQSPMQQAIFVCPRHGATPPLASFGGNKPFCALCIEAALSMVVQPLNMQLIEVKNEEAKTDDKEQSADVAGKSDSTN
jgi:hypothetical protein